jgi:ribosomal protein S27AE
MTRVTPLEPGQTIPRMDGQKANSGDRVHRRCARCGHEVVYSPHDEQCGVCGWEWLDLVYRGVTRDDIITNCDALGRTSMWRYRKLLPVLDDRNIVGMGVFQVRSRQLARNRLMPI